MKRPQAKIHHVRCCDGRTATWREKWELEACGECGRKLPGRWIQVGFSPLPTHAGPITTDIEVKPLMSAKRTETCGHCGSSWPSLAGMLSEIYDKAVAAAAVNVDSDFLCNIRGKVEPARASRLLPRVRR